MNIEITDERAWEVLEYARDNIDRVLEKELWHLHRGIGSLEFGRWSVAVDVKNEIERFAVCALVWMLVR